MLPEAVAGPTGRRDRTAYRIYSSEPSENVWRVDRRKKPRASSPAGGKPGNAGGSPTPPWLWLLLLAGFALIFYQFRPPNETSVSYTWFLEQVNDGNIKTLALQGTEVHGELIKKDKYLPPSGSPPVNVEKFYTYFPSESSIDTVLTKVRQVADKKKIEPPRVDTSPANTANGLVWLTLLLPTFLIVGLIYFMMRRARDQFDGGILGSFVKSPAKRHDKSKQRTTFDEVAGLENAKGELQEIVEFLKNPEKFQRLGGRIPKGVLLIGPPGSGKTLLARAVAGEAGVPFFSISGSEFIQMFVGVGASRVRDMFKTAKENSPCILFIDEIDAVGRVRGAGLGGGHDEREQTLNQILTEMDGFSPNESVIVLAATNRPDVLDPALLRPGRFDRHVTVDRPTRKGRLEILKVHTRNMPLDDDVDLDSIARGTVGMSGADLANLVNEAALLATREDKDKVDMRDFDAARDKIIMGAKREEIITEKDKRADGLSRGRPRAGGLADAERRPGPQGDDHPPRPGPGRHAVPARGRPPRHQRKRSACRFDRRPRRPRRRAPRVQRPDRGRGRRPETWPPGWRG